jgi:hypothetical protein
MFPWGKAKQKVAFGGRTYADNQRLCLHNSFEKKRISWVNALGV